MLPLLAVERFGLSRESVIMAKRIRDCDAKNLFTSRALSFKLPAV
jgi:hypothetical protein